VNRKGKKFYFFNFSLSLPAVQKSAYQIYVWSNRYLVQTAYSHLSNKRGGWNKRGGGANNAKSLNVEGVINVNF
jgi:hypothetical protein